MSEPKIENCLYCQHLSDIEFTQGVVTAYCDLPHPSACIFVKRADTILVFGGEEDMEDIMEGECK